MGKLDGGGDLVADLEDVVAVLDDVPVHAVTLGALREAGWWLDLEEAWGVPGAGGAVRCAVPARNPLEEELVLLLWFPCLLVGY